MVKYMKLFLLIVVNVLIQSQYWSIAKTTSSESTDVRNRADSLKNAKSFADAIPLYDSLLVQQIDQFENLVSKGECQAQIGEINQSLETFKLAIAIDSTNAGLWKSIGDAYLFANLPQSAIKSYTRSIQLNGANSKTYSSLGAAYQRLNHVDTAERAFKKALDIDSMNHEAWYNWSLLLHSKGSVDQAIQCLKRSISSKEDFAPAFNNLGMLYYGAGFPDSALASFNAAILLDKQNALYYNNAGLACLDKRDTLTAYNFFKNALRYDSMNVKALYNAGLTSYFLLQYKDGIQFITKALQQQPNVPDYWYTLGLIHASSNEKHLASGYWLKCMSLDSTNSSYSYAIGSLYDDNSPVKREYYTISASLGNEKAKTWLIANPVKTEILPEPKKTETKKSKKKKK
ncbi:MAG: hypothetical protein EBU66_12905 [Bacteroidetes bacterium]|nr:hypothetical protein [Bacteroidota bacterium]